jgi:hypothetical protein
MACGYSLRDFKPQRCVEKLEGHNRFIYVDLDCIALCKRMGFVGSGNSEVECSDFARTNSNTGFEIVIVRSYRHFFIFYLFFFQPSQPK